MPEPDLVSVPLLPAMALLITKGLLLSPKVTAWPLATFSVVLPPVPTNRYWPRACPAVAAVVPPAPAAPPVTAKVPVRLELVMPLMVNVPPGATKKAPPNAPPPPPPLPVLPKPPVPA